MEKNLLKKILQAEQTVFSFKELLLMAQPIDRNRLKSRLSYYVRSGNLYHIRRGIYVKDSNYDRLELATKILLPAYISFETVLASAGVIFQYYSQIFVASYQTREVECDRQLYVFKKIKDTVLTNNQGVHIGDRYSIASKERAFLDTVYVYKRYYFDNLEPLDWDKVYQLLPVYGQDDAFCKKIDAYYKEYKEDV